MSQAVKQYMADEGVDDLRNTPLTAMSYDDWVTAYEVAQKATEDFVRKYLKVVKECEEGCFADNYKTQANGISPVNAYTNDGKFVLADGMVLDIFFANDTTPLYLRVDVNGKKGPNKVGYDLWDMDIFYDGSIDESGVNPDCKQGKIGKGTDWLCGNYGSTPIETREARFESCLDDNVYGGCFGHFLENGFKFDY